MIVVCVIVILILWYYSEVLRPDNSLISKYALVFFEVRKHMTNTHCSYA